MNVGGISSNPLLALFSGSNAGANGVSGFLPSQNGAAKSAVATSILPSAAPVQMSTESLLMLQGEKQDAPEAQTVSLEQPSVEDQFLAEAHKTPMQRMREQILKALGVSEEQLAQMPADQRAAMEDRIKQLIEEKIREAHNAGKDAPSSNTDMLQSLA